MPGNIAAASPSGVLPQTLCTAFSEQRIYPMLANTYHDGTPELALITDGVNVAASLRSWRMSKRLTSADWATLKSFIESHNCDLTPFYFYNPFEPLPGHAVGSNYDASGVSITGRYTCVFTMGGWAELVGSARTDIAEIAFKEVA